MKHLKKILIVIVVLALIATSAVAVIAADRTNKQSGDVEQLSSFLSQVGSATDDASKSAILCDFYAYHDSVSWTGSEDGYSGYMNEAATQTVTIGRALFDAYLVKKANTALTDVEKMKVLASVNAHFVGCTAPVGTNGLADLLARLETENLIYTEKYYNAYLASVGGGAPDYTAADSNVLSLYEFLVQCYPLSDAGTHAKYEAAAVGMVQRAFDKYNTIPKDSDFDTPEKIAKVEAYKAKKSENANIASQINNAEKPMDMVRKLAYFDRTNEILIIKGYVDLTGIDVTEEVTLGSFGFTIPVAVGGATVPTAGKINTVDNVPTTAEYDGKFYYLTATEGDGFVTYEGVSEGGGASTLTLVVTDAGKATVTVDAAASNELDYSVSNDSAKTEVYVYFRLMNGFEAALAAREAEVAAKASALDSLADLDSYDLPVIFNKNYDGDLTSEEIANLTDKAAYKAQNDLLVGGNSNNEYKTAKVFEGEGDEKNGYQTFIYPETTSLKKHLYTQPGVNGKAEENGMVFEFDLRFTHGFANFMVYCVHGAVSGSTHLTSNTVTWLTPANDISIRTTSFDGVHTDLRGIAKMNIWQHYTMTYDPETKLGSLYVNYELVSTIYYKWTDMENDIVNGLRIGPAGAEAGIGWDIDNLQFYAGTQPRNIDKFTSMTVDEQFKYFVEYAANDKNLNFLSRNTAYKRAEMLFSQFENKPAFASYVATFRAINYEEDIKKEAMKINLSNLAELVGELEVPTSENLAEVQDAINKINDFVDKNGELINKADTSEGGYQSLMGDVYAKQAIIDHVNNAFKFIEAVEKFERATTLVALRRHAATAEEIYKNAGFDDPAVWDIVKDDPAIVEFEEAYNNTVVNNEGRSIVLKKGQVLTSTLEVLSYSIEVEDAYTIIRYYLAPTDENYQTISKVYASFQTQIDNREKYENSRRIVSCIDYMLSIEGYEATPEFWGANQDTIAPYMTIIRNMVNENAYDPDYEGIDEALAVFNEANVYFYKLLQQQHIAAITEYLARYTATESYIEKLSAVRTIENYLENEDIATHNPTLSKAVLAAVAEEIEILESLEISCNVYAGELDGLESAFGDVLEQQTQYFINIINYMKTLTSYAELEEQFEAATAYYNAINVDSEEALAATEAYRAYRDSLAKTRENSALFVANVKAISDAADLTGMDKRDAMYVAIKNCMQYADDLVDNDRGTSAALEVYEAAIAEYNGDNAAYAEAALETGALVNAARVSEISAAVLAVVSAMLEN